MEHESQLRFHGMSLRFFTRVWITLTNFMCLGVIGIGFVQDYELSSLGRVGYLVFAALLLLGIVLEWRGFTRPALIINAGFFAVPGFAVLGKVLVMLWTKSTAQYDPEALLAVTIVGIRFTLVALADCVLYWANRPARSA